MNPQRELITPLVIAGLQQDTGVSATDSITFNSTITGTIADINAIAVFTAGFDGNPVSSFRDVLADLQTNGTCTLSAAHRPGARFGGEPRRGNLASCWGRYMWRVDLLLAFLSHMREDFATLGQRSSLRLARHFSSVQKKTNACTIERRNCESWVSEERSVQADCGHGQEEVTMNSL
jgi:hypothetical protein